MHTQMLAGERRPFRGEMATFAAIARNEPLSFPPSWDRTVIDAQRAATVEFYDRTGGIAHTDDVLQSMRRSHSQPISLLARWIVAQSVVCFDWRSQWLLPKFQFDVDGVTIRPAVAAVLMELDGTFDGWELATWFMEPNVWLEGSRPMDLLDGNLQAVLAAARADRFIARG